MAGPLVPFRGRASMPRPDKVAKNKSPTNRRVPAGPASPAPSLGQTLTQLEENMAYELVLNRLLDAPADKLYRLWTDPARMKDWFCPKPWMVTKAELDVRPGGACNITMSGPNGEVMP